MVYAKSFLVGVAALVLAVTIVLALAYGALAIHVEISARSGDGGVGAVEGSWIPLWPLAAVALSIFAAGFYWNFRRARRHR